MKLSNYKAKTFRVAPIPVKTIDDGVEKEAILNIKYRPLDRDWFNSYERVQKKIEAIREDTLSQAKSLDEDEKKLVELQMQFSVLEAESEEAKELQQQLQAQTKEVEKGREELKAILEQASLLQQNLMAEQLLPILIDLDLTDDDNKPIEITMEFLSSLDYELLLDIGETIGKKTFRNREKP